MDYHIMAKCAMLCVASACKRHYKGIISLFVAFILMSFIVEHHHITDKYALIMAYIVCPIWAAISVEMI